MEKINVRSLSLQIGQKQLLRQLDFELPMGQSLVIIGESGSGKTLLTKLMIGQIPPQAEVSGRIEYGQEELLQLGAADWQRIRGSRIAYMVQNPMAMFNPFQKIKKHFWETLRSHAPLTKEACLEQALLSMQEVRLSHPQQLLDKYPFELSGGMLQRVMLAILLCLDPETIILDEPTSALDSSNRDNILRLIKELLERGKTILTVTHDYELAAELGGHMLVLYQGEIVEQGSVGAILSHPQHPYTQELILQNPYERLVSHHAEL